MYERHTLTALVVGLLAVLAIAVFSGPTKSQELTQSDERLYDINGDGCIIRKEIDAIISLLAPEATTLVDEDNFVVFTAPNQTTDMAIEFGADGCVLSSTLIPKGSSV